MTIVVDDGLGLVSEDIVDISVKIAEYSPDNTDSEDLYGDSFSSIWPSLIYGIISVAGGFGITIFVLKRKKYPNK